jgi:hypothetical protein
VRLVDYDYDNDKRISYRRNGFSKERSKNNPDKDLLANYVFCHCHSQPVTEHLPKVSCLMGISKVSDRKKFMAQHFALSGNPP